MESKIRQTRSAAWRQRDRASRASQQRNAVFPVAGGRSARPGAPPRGGCGPRDGQNAETRPAARGYNLLRMLNSKVLHWLFVSVLCLAGWSPVVRGDELSAGFLAPPPAARPWVFWMWLRVDTTPEAITKDLEEMHAKGIEGCILYDCGPGTMRAAKTTMVLQGKGYKVIDTPDFPNAQATAIPMKPLTAWTPLWRERIRFASKEAGRLGIKLCLSVGLAGTSGPIAAEDGQQKLVWSEATVTGPRSYDEVLPEPAKRVSATNVPLKTLMPRVSKEKFPLHEVAVLAIPDRDECRPDEVVDLSTRLDGEGHLHWEVPAGAWKIMRFGYLPTGAQGTWGFYTDDMSAEAMDHTWEATVGPLLKEMSPEERRGLMGVEDDSWESGETTWTRQFATEFQRRRRYNLLPWLPVLAGQKIGQPEQVEGVRRDYFRTVADLIAVNHYARLGQLAKQNGLTSFAEPAGPNSGQLDLMQNCGGIDRAMGEYWVPSVHRPTPARRFLLRNAASANHLYGGPITPCEAFTSVGPFWEESLFDMKNTADQAFCDGCNLPIIHNYSHSPSIQAKPGYVYFAGTHYSRNVTWWEQTPAFNAYLGRCSFLLQQGLFVADALYYRGDAIGGGEPMKTQPALPAPGYDHDNCNLDALLTRVSVRNRRLVLPDGMSYRLLVLPDASPLAPEALEKIAALVDGGAAVVGPRPAGLAGFPVPAPARAKFDALVTRLWGNEAPAKDLAKGGRIAANVQPAEVLRELGAPPDFEYQGLSSEGELDWIHRSADGAEIYFVASRWDPREKITATFRVAGKQPELWDPVTGEMRDATAFRQEGGRTMVPLEFNPRGSVFVVFRRPLASGASGAAASNYPEARTQAAVTGAWEVEFDPAWGGPARVTFDGLADWTKRPEPEIQHYSGTAVYHKDLRLAAMPPAGERLLLNLGEVHEVASVRLNGKECGVAWTHPMRVDITRAVHAGENQLEVRVVNLWPNRIIGDDGLPPEKRFTETNMHKFSASTPLYPSGLIGPVTLEKIAP